MTGGSLGRGNLGNSSLGTIRGGTVTSAAFLYAEQGITEWAPDPHAKLTAEQAIVEWAPDPHARLTAEQALPEWVPTSHAILRDVQHVVEFIDPVQAWVTFIRPMVEWAIPQRGYLFAETLIAEWVPGNVMTADRGRLVIGWSRSALENGDMYHRSLADFALAELEQGGERDQDPAGGPGSGDGFPVSGNPPPTLPDGGAGLARYKNDTDDETDWGPPLV